MVLGGLISEVGSYAAVSTLTNTPEAWWVWPLLLFLTTFALGIVAPMAGIGGGVMFTPIVAGFFPFNLDFVRAAGLLVALSGSVAATPALLRRNMGSLRLAIPVALVASIGSVFGAYLGLTLPERLIQVLMGATIISIATLFMFSRSTEFPEVKKPDALATTLGIKGTFHDQSNGKSYQWSTHHTLLGLVLFLFIGIMAGMFGLGAGWANMPVLNLLLGVPLKVAVGTSMVMLAITDTSAAWIYLNHGAVLPLIVVPSIFGMMLGARLGVRLLSVTKPTVIRYMVIAILFLSGLRPLGQGLGVW